MREAARPRVYLAARRAPYTDVCHSSDEIPALMHAIADGTAAPLSLVEPGRKRRPELIKKRTCSLGNSAKNLCSAISAAQGRKGMLGVVNVRQSGGGANGERGSPRLCRRLSGSIDRLSGSGDSPPPNGERRSSPGRARRRVTS